MSLAGDEMNVGQGLKPPAKGLEPLPCGEDLIAQKIQQLERSKVKNNEEENSESFICIIGF